MAVTIRTPSRSELELECKYQRQGFLKKTMTDSAWRKTIGICRAISRTARELGIESVWTVADLDEMAKMIDQLKHGGPLDFSSAARQFDPEKIE